MSEPYNEENIVKIYQKKITKIDKKLVLNSYCRIQHKDGRNICWLSSEDNQTCCGITELSGVYTNEQYKTKSIRKKLTKILLDYWIEYLSHNTNMGLIITTNKVRNKELLSNLKSYGFKKHITFYNPNSTNMVELLSFKIQQDRKRRD